MQPEQTFLEPKNGNDTSKVYTGDGALVALFPCLLLNIWAEIGTHIFLFLTKLKKNIQKIKNRKEGRKKPKGVYRRFR